MIDRTDRERIYLLTTGEHADYNVKFIIRTERSIDRLFGSYKIHTDRPRRAKLDWGLECEPFVRWMRKMELCKILDVGEFNLDKKKEERNGD